MLTDSQQQINALKNDFSNPLEHANALDIDSMDRVSITDAKAIPELNHFFGLDHNGPYSEFLQRGLRSLRVGFYKLCSPPIYNNNVFPATFSADVYYFYPNDECNKLIKYRANIGPMVNAHHRYIPLPDTHSYTSVSEIPILNKFEKERYSIGKTEDHYYQPKKNFFNELYKTGKMFFVIESIFDPAFPDNNPRPIRITWSFIDF